MDVGINIHEERAHDQHKCHEEHTDVRRQHNHMVLVLYHTTKLQSSHISQDWLVGNL